MKRNIENLKLYRESCKKVIERADSRCEVMVDNEGKALSDKPKHRCFKFIHEDDITYTNFLHTATRNGKSDEWVLDPENITFGCKEHHYEEETEVGGRVERVEYDDEELRYIPDEE